MPLSSGTTKNARQENIKREIAAGKEPSQAIAIGYSKQRENKAKKAAASRDTEVSNVRGLVKDLYDCIKGL